MEKIHNSIKHFHGYKSQYDYYRTSKVIDKVYSSQSMSINDIINYRSFCLNSIMFIKNRTDILSIDYKYIELMRLINETKKNRETGTNFDYIHDSILCDEYYTNSNVKFITSRYSTISRYYTSFYYNVEFDYYFLVKTFERRNF